MVQDHNGFLWLGTQDGLNRYDGDGFTTFKHDDEIPESLANNFVWALHVDRNGTLWIGTEGGGLDRWNPADDSFTHYRHVPSDGSSLVDDEIRALDEDQDGAIWIGTGGGLSRFSPESGLFKHFIHDENDSNSISENRIRAVLADRVGRIWIGTFEGGLNRKDPASDIFTRYNHNPEDENSLSSDKIKTIREDAHGNIWIGTYDGGLNRLEPKSGRVTRFRADPNHRNTIGHDRVRALFTDSTGTLWVGTDDGLSRLLDGANRFETYRHDPADPNSLSSDRILSIYQDRAGLLWVATQAGLTHRNTAMETFSHGKQDPDAESTLSSNIITGFSEGKHNTVWVGTYGGGLSGLNLETGDYTHLKHDDKDGGSLGDDRVMSLYNDSRGNLWVGTMASGLSIRYAGSKNFIHLRHNPEDPASLSADGVTAITEDGDGTIWIGTYRGGLNRLLEDGRSFSHYRHDESSPTSLSSDQVMSLHADPEGTIWVGTKDGGLNRLDPKTGLFSHYTNDPEDPSSLGSDTVWTIYEDSERTLWLGTQGGGLNRWSFADRSAGNETFYRYTVENGLADDLIYGVLEDRSGNLWLSSNQGLSRFNIKTEVISNFDTTHGLQSPEFNFGAYFQNEAGVMFFGGNNGFNYFHPDDVRKNDHVPPVVLTGILKMNEKVILEQPTWDLDELVVDYWDHMVSFDFAALDFSAPEKNRYAYRLEGFDADWIDLGTLRRATYTNLDPGEYTLHVRASNNDGLWNEAGITLPIRVLPPPWKTWWAYSLYATALLLLLIGFVRIQARKLRREEENSRQLELSVRERTEELAIKNIELEEASLTDSLTGLRNRRYFQQHLQDDIALIDREYELRRINGTLSELNDSGLMCLMIDLDGFKAVNDNFGHAAGDLVLLATCKVLSSIVRKSDTLLRWGGDEFLIVARSTKRESANILAERIRIAISELEVRVDNENTARVGCSLGFAFYPFLPSAPRLLAWEQVLNVADRALYLAKANGKDAWVGISARESARRPDLINLLMSNLEPLHHEGAIDVTSNLEPDELWTDQSETKKRSRGDGSAA
jgi:diguanylate cyclase (GGDEF)-like protein